MRGKQQKQTKRRKRVNLIRSGRKKCCLKKRGKLWGGDRMALVLGEGGTGG